MTVSSPAWTASSLRGHHHVAPSTATAMPERDRLVSLRAISSTPAPPSMTAPSRARPAVTSAARRSSSRMPPTTTASSRSTPAVFSALAAARSGSASRSPAVATPSLTSTTRR